mmetsp:Transcript_15671/g.42250  ORF Transcript_15671/g.42250 Transcript_15671/m.42250 type:complete len:299 (+) Transcript_15671:104-1000(+)
MSVKNVKAQMNLSELELTSVELYEAMRMKFSLLVVVYFRSDWCPVCHFWMKRWAAIERLPERLEMADVGMLFVSSGDHAAVDEVRQIHGFARHALAERAVFLSDAENLLAKHHATSGLLRVHSTRLSASNERVSPAYVLVDRAGTALMNWALEPTAFSVTSRVARPDPVKIWAEIEQYALPRACDPISPRSLGSKSRNWTNAASPRSAKNILRSSSSSFALDTIFESDEEDAAARDSDSDALSTCEDGFCFQDRWVTKSKHRSRRTLVSPEPESLVYLREMISNVLSPTLTAAESRSQ